MAPLLKFFFELILPAGDNKGLNKTCGFVGSFSANHFCRICYASKEECQTMVREVSSKLRKKDNYELDLKKNQSVSGIKERCVFNQIVNFHIYENYSVDVFHDLWEGVAKCTVRNVLETLIKSEDNELSLNILNSRIDSFSYNQSELSNKPRPAFYDTSKKGGRKLKLKQSQMLGLTRYLGLIIGDLIPYNDKHWRLYKYLRNIL